MARLAFAACAPGQTPTDEQLAALIAPRPLNPGNAASLKRLIFEAQTLICSEVKNKAGKREDSSHATFAGPERDARILQQRTRLTGLRFRGEEECSHTSYDLVLSVLEKDCLTYLGPEKFPTRRNELLQKKPSKEITIDQSQLIVKEKQAELTCSTITELEVSNAFKRRALAFDLAGAITYSVMAAYHADLLDHLHLPSPPGYSPVSVQQVLRADRAAFLYMSERLTTLKRNAVGELPLDALLPGVLMQPTKAEEKANQRRVAGGQMSLPLSSGKPLRHHRRRGCAGVSTCQTGAMQLNQVKPVPKGCMFVPNQGALSTIRCKIIVEPKTVSPQKLGCKGSQLVTFSQ